MNNTLYNQVTHNVNVETDKLKNEIISLNTELEKLIKREDELIKSGEKNTKSYQDVAVQVRMAKDAIKETTLQIDNNTKALNLSKGSLEQNKALLAALREQYTSLSKSNGDNSKELSQLNTLLQSVSKSVDEQEQKVTKGREGFDLHKKSIEAVQSSLSDLKEKGKSFGPTFSSTIEDASKGFNAMKDGLSTVKTGFQSVGGAIKTTGFGLLLLVLESVVEYFTKTKKGSEKLRMFLAGVGVVVNTVKENFSKFKLAIVEAFTNPVEGLKKLGKLIEDNILNRVKAFAVMYDAIINKDFKKFANGVVQLATGTTDAFAKVEKAYKENSDEALKNKAELDKDKAAQEKKQKEEAKKRADAAEKRRQKREAQRQANLEKRKRHNEEVKKLNDEANNELLASRSRMAQNILQGYAEEINATENHFKELKDKYKNHKATVEQLEKERVAAIAAINKKFRDEDNKKLDDYHSFVSQMALDHITDAKQKALILLQQETDEKIKKIEDGELLVKKRIEDEQALIKTLNEQGRAEDAAAEQKKLDAEINTLEKAGKIKAAILTQQKQQENAIVAGNDPNATEQKTGEDDATLKIKAQLLNWKAEKDAAVAAAKEKGQSLFDVEASFAAKKINLEAQLVSAKIHQGDGFINAVLQNTKKESAIYKAAFIAKKATSISDVIVTTSEAVMKSFGAYSSIPFIGQALGIAQAAFMAAQGATSIATIVKQKPGMAKGGQFISDGRGALLPGYSRTDNTNAYLRSGEAVVVSEAMRNPWARNLVSAINVAYGGRDFSIPNTGSGYAIGGVFTDGGNASRYYSQPMNDQKDLANTLAYQMLNNFPPIYVDVKDVNNQQNILAQTVNRVNL